MAKVYRITFGFDPITYIDVIKENIVDAITDSLKYVQEQGNDVDSTIVIKAELFLETNELKIPESSTETTEKLE